jgi:hypothetical protein
VAGTMVWMDDVDALPKLELLAAAHWGDPGLRAAGVGPPAGVVRPLLPDARLG